MFYTFALVRSLFSNALIILGGGEDAKQLSVALKNLIPKQRAE